ncbi:SusC/RagA family TonB-linked outer membrane protein [Dysgonomonas sp. 520]|uniref:SusC/RagA family TonB-linked outer membrane protein n=1 Tax=Dysgonomonas sp. 520 TaxID=2302931 RepID=UPI0013D86C8D|nr:SusC/RagA family TonB-linked outer membrane protein [Dysgonomonas sp. 520]NDW10359.1 SusC/RagA family TonB-linked outer membrane protein [Dysgonomonas sp. 520]
MKKWLYSLFLFFSLSISASYAQKTITGVVVDEEKEPLIGVTITVKGTASGVVTDFDGKYSVIVADNNATLVFAYLGMHTQEIKVGTSAVIDVTLKAQSTLIDEVVVTAMGVVAEKRRMNFAVQSINSDDILAARSTNFIDALQGKIAGVNITNQGGSPNGGSQLIIRGISSINSQQNNEPLFVIDGMHISGGSGSMAALNPNDIENVTVLKGAAASALYGQEGANGVIMITTKSAQKGRTVISANASLQVDNAFRVPELQSTYLPGGRGIIGASPTTGGWGPIAPAGTEKYDNADNFFQTALMQKYDVSVSAGSEKFTAYGSLNYTSQEGIIPSDKVDRVGMLLKASFDPTPTLNISFMSNIINTKANDPFPVSTASTLNAMMSTRSSVLSRVYSWPINNDMRNYKDQYGDIDWLYRADILGNSPLNPYWRANEDYNQTESTRNLLQAAATWKPVKGLQLSGRLGYEHSNSMFEEYTTPRFSEADYVNRPEEIVSNDKYESARRELFGTHNMRSARGSMFSAQAIARYTYSINKDMSIEAMLGTELKENKSTSIRIGGSEYIITGSGFYSINNLKNSVTGANQDNYPGFSKKRTYGYFGELRYDYKGLASLSVTLRNDHTSTLLEGENSYWYPSVTGGLVFSELFNLTSDIFSFGKLRGNWAKVGKDASPYQFGQKFVQKPNFPDGGFGVDPTLSVAYTLKPEMNKSWEIGADLRFFNNRTRLDVAYYSTGVDNQIVSVRVTPSSGTIMQTRNEGSIENKGLELSLEQDILKTKEWNLMGFANFSFNRSKVVSLPDGQDKLSFDAARVGSDIFPSAWLNESTTGIIGKDYLRNENGKVIVTEDGNPIINPEKFVYLGNREPDFIMGIGSKLNYREFGLSFQFDIRKGGDVVNGTSRSLMSSGMHERLETYRNRQIVVDGVVNKGTAENPVWAQNTTPVTFDQLFYSTYYEPVSSNFIEDGSYVRLSYVTLSYDFTKFIKKTIFKTLSVAATGRNLFLWTRYSGSDPQVNSLGNSGGSGSMGIDNLNVPKTRSFSFTVNATF